MQTGQSHIRQEQRVLKKMLEIYCAGRHGTQQGLCEECETLRGYAAQRLERCPFGEHRGTCAKCPIHCYKADMRRRVRQVMRYAGPRMLYKHPIFAIKHLLDSFKGFPERNSR